MEINPANKPEDNHSTGWENMDNNANTAFKVSHETREATIPPEAYEQFANDNLTKLLSSLEDPTVNVDDASERVINAQLAITANILDTLNRTEPGQTQDILNDISTKYQTLHDEHATHGQEHNADLDQRLVDATTVIRGQFAEYLASQ